MSEEFPRTRRALAGDGFAFWNALLLLLSTALAILIAWLWRGPRPPVP